jgi:hypothetical protein
MWSNFAGLGLLLLQMPASVPSHAEEPPSSSNGGFGSFLWLMLGMVIGVVIGLLISKAFGKPRNKAEDKRPLISSNNNDPAPVISSARSAPAQAKRCPVCNSTYTDEALVYCVSDGATLISANRPSAHDPAATITYPEPRQTDVPPTEAYRPNK